MLIIMSVLGAVVMPHNLFVHSEVIQSHEYNKQDESCLLYTSRIRVAILVSFVWIGGLKFWNYEAEGIVPFRCV